MSKAHSTTSQRKSLPQQPKRRGRSPKAGRSKAARPPVEDVFLLDEEDTVVESEETPPEDEPVVEEGLYCAESQLVYPIVSDIPIMLIEEALPASSVGVGR